MKRNFQEDNCVLIHYVVKQDHRRGCPGIEAKAVTRGAVVTRAHQATPEFWDLPKWWMTLSHGEFSLNLCGKSWARTLLITWS